MNNDALKSYIEIFASVILVPYVTWVTVSIFNLRQAQALMKMEMGLMREIKDWLLLQKREKSCNS